MATHVLSSSRLGLFTSVRAFLLSLPQLSAITVPTATPIQLTLPEIWESILRAVPKKKQSHSRRRMRQLAGKALKDITALNRCPACGGLKRANILCKRCVEVIGDMWREEKTATR